MLMTTCEIVIIQYEESSNYEKNEELQKIYLIHFFHTKVTMNKIVNFKKYRHKCELWRESVIVA